MKKTVKKLRLNKHIVTKLTDQQLARVIGKGAPDTGKRDEGDDEGSGVQR